jgi:glutathione S-transferase
MKYKLYNRDGSGGFVVEAALVLADASFDLVKLDSKPGTPLPATFREVNPWGQVPVLILPDGTKMTESAAIALHLAACYPDKRLGPVPGTTEHAVFLRWMIFMSANVYEGVLRAGYPERYTTDPSGARAVSEAGENRLGEALRTIEAELEPGPFLLGATMTLADVYLAMMFNWYRGDNSLPRVTALRKTVASNPVLVALWRRHFGDL